MTHCLDFVLCVGNPLFNSLQRTRSSQEIKGRAEGSIGRGTKAQILLARGDSEGQKKTSYNIAGGRLNSVLIWQSARAVVFGAKASPTATPRKVGVPKHSNSHLDSLSPSPSPSPFLSA